MSRRPKASTAAFTIAAGAASVAISTPRLSIDGCSKVSSAPGRSTASTRAPSLANSSALARPMPLAAPVTMAARPEGKATRVHFVGGDRGVGRPGSHDPGGAGGAVQDPRPGGPDRPTGVNLGSVSGGRLFGMRSFGDRRLRSGDNRSLAKPGDSGLAFELHGV